MEQEKSKPIASFNIFVKINIPISGKEEDKERIKKYCEKKKITITEYCEKILKSGLKNAGIKNYEELLKQSGNYDLVIRSIKDSMTGFLGTSNISRYLIEETKKVCDDEKD